MATTSSIQPPSASTLFGTTSGSGSTDSSSGLDASATLEAISNQVAALQQQKTIQTQDFQKQTNDVQVDNRMTARDVGILRQNDSRLNVFSSLSKGDAADFFTFNVATSAQTRFGVLTANPDEAQNVRFQIINQASGTVLADSDPNAGDAHDVYTQLQNGTYNMEAGKYIMRVTRADDSVSNQNTEYNYAVQLSQGTFTKDFDTVEQAAQEGADPYGLGANNALDTLTASLGSAVSMLQALPPIGTSATDKLNGILLNSVV